MKKYKPYKLQRWWIHTGWETIQQSEDKDKIYASFYGWSKMIRDCTLRVKSPSGRVVKTRYGSLYKSWKKGR